MGIIRGFLIMKNCNTTIIYKKPLTNQHNIIDTQYEKLQHKIIYGFSDIKNTV